MKTALELMEDHAKALEAQRDALAAKLEVSEAASRAAVSKAEWQARTNHEMNEAAARIRELEYVVRAISQWDMLNPVRTDLIGDLGWLKRLVDDVLTPAETKGEQG